MTNEEYRQHFDHLVMCTRSFLMLSTMLSDAELAEMLHSVELASSVGCFTDPMAWMKAESTGTLDRQRALIKAHIDIRMALGEHFTLPGVPR